MKDLLSFRCLSTLNKQRNIKIHLARKLLFNTSVTNLPKSTLVIYLPQYKLVFLYILPRVTPIQLQHNVRCQNNTASIQMIKKSFALLYSINIIKCFPCVHFEKTSVLTGVNK
jgi:hypothetical protein